MSKSDFNVGAYVRGAVTSPRALVRHADLLAAYADGVMLDRGDTGEAYLSHFAFGREMRAHHQANGNSVAEYAGPCWCRWLVLDIDRADAGAALADARRLVQAIGGRYPELNVPVYFSGSKGWHVLIELAHGPPPAVGFQHTARAFAEFVAQLAGVAIDTTDYDVNRIVRLPNTRHPKTGRFKRRIDADDLFRLDVPQILDLATHPAGDGLPAARTCPANLTTDWSAAERLAASKADARAAIRRDHAADSRAPKWLMDFVRYGVADGGREVIVFRGAAWMTEQGAPPSLCLAFLTEPGRDAGLSPKEVERAIRCGIGHARRQRAAPDEPAPENRGDAYEHPLDRLDAIDPAALDFPFGALAPETGEGGPT